MIVLQITEDKRQELNESCIVICTYKTVSGQYVDAITYSYKTQYPDFIEVEVLGD